jgi:hypothetical protein
MSEVTFDLSSSEAGAHMPRAYTSSNSISFASAGHVIRENFKFLAGIPWGHLDTSNKAVLLRNFNRGIDVVTIYEVVDTAKLRAQWMSVASATSLRAHLMRAQELEKKGRVADAMDIVFKEVDAALRRGRIGFGECDELLENLDIATLSLRMLMGLLSITLAASRGLPSRRRFFNAAYRELKSQGKDPNRLIGGLRGGRAADGKNLFAGSNAR